MLERKIREVEQRIAKRQSEYREDPQDLQERVAGDRDKPSLSGWGRRKLINMDKALLAALKAYHFAYCNCGKKVKNAAASALDQDAESFIQTLRAISIALEQVEQFLADIGVSSGDLEEDLRELTLAAESL